eukprot:562592-Pelagomonas_calceolata.AAC.1
MAEILFLTNHWDAKSPKTTQLGAVGGQEWRLGGQKVGFTPRLIWRCAPILTGQALVLKQGRLQAFAPMLDWSSLGRTLPHAGSISKTPVCAKILLPSVYSIMLIKALSLTVRKGQVRSACQWLQIQANAVEIEV